jgi:hypothetical protein
MIAGLLFLQIPSSLIFYPLAAVFAITGIFVLVRHAVQERLAGSQSDAASGRPVPLGRLPLLRAGAARKGTKG